MDDVFERLMDGAGVPPETRPEILKALHRLKTRYPRETPARLFDRARKEGAPIPAARCNHGVVRGECVVCEPRIGARYYFTSGGSQVHSLPNCPALAGGNAAPIEVVRTLAGEPCSQCVKPASAPRPTRRPSPAPSSHRAPVARARSVLPRIGPAELTPAEAPSIGDRILWSGYDGVVTAVTDRGVGLTVDGIRMTAPWGDRATIHRQRAPS